MTPKFLRAEAARFREMAETITDREASRQRLLGMATDYEARANAAAEAQPTEQMPEPPSEPAPDEAVTPGVEKPTPGNRRLRSARTLTLPGTPGK
jgi:hypothetical protein